MSSLREVLTGHLAGQASLDEVIEALHRTQRELDAHQKDVASFSEQIPDFLIGVERVQWLTSYHELEDRLKKTEKDLSNLMLEELSKHLPGLEQELKLRALTLREAAWSAHGPSSHPGVNEMLHLLERFLDDPNDDLCQLIATKCDIEFSRFQCQVESYLQQPEIVSQAMEELLPEYRALLENISHIDELESEDMERLLNQLELWGGAFSAYDLDFLCKRYSQLPTSVPTVNFALNCQLLYIEDVVTTELVDYALGLAQETLQTASELFLAESKLSAVEEKRYVDALAELVAGLEGLAELENKSELREFGHELVRLTQTLVEIQSKAEIEGGSRLDFKTE